MGDGPGFLPLAPGVLAVRCPKPHSHTGMVSMVVANGARLAVIDTGMREHALAALLPALDALGARPQDIAILCATHGHADHIGGCSPLRELTSAAACFSPLDAELAGTAPDLPTRAGQVIDLGGLRFEVLPTPGHTPGSSCFYERSLRLLIAGDAVQSRGSAGRLPVYYDSGRDYRASLRELLRIPVETLLTGHPLRGPGLEGCIHRGADTCRDLLTSSLAYAQAVERAVATGVRTLTHAPAEPLHFPTLRRFVLDELSREPLYADGELTSIELEEDEDITATLLSETRDLGILLEAAPSVRR